MEKKFKNLRELANATSIPIGTLSSFYYSRKRVRRADQRLKIFEVTGIESYKSKHPSGSESDELKEWIRFNVKIKSGTSKTSKPTQSQGIRADTKKGVELHEEKKSVTIQEDEDIRINKIITLAKRFDVARSQLEKEISTVGGNVTERIRKSLNLSKGGLEDKVVDAFYTLADLLSQMKESSPSQRKLVTSRIEARDVGYVTAFLRAMYDEDHFSDFIFFSEYKAGEKRNEQ